MAPTAEPASNMASNMAPTAEPASNMAGAQVQDPGEFEWSVAQDIPKISADFRKLEARKVGRKVGHSSTANTTKTQPAVKRKREEEDEIAANDQMDFEACAQPPAAKQRKTVARDITGVGSSRAWKLAADKRASASHRKQSTSWDSKMQHKQTRQLCQAAAREARQAYKDATRLKHEALAAAKKKKEENKRQNAMRHSVAISTATAKKLQKSKKARKQLTTG